MSFSPPLPELLIAVFRFCDSSTLASISSVNRVFYQLAGDELYRAVRLNVVQAERFLDVAQHCLSKIQHLTLVRINNREVWRKFFLLVSQKSSGLVSLRMYRDGMASGSGLKEYEQCVLPLFSIPTLKRVEISTYILSFASVLQNPTVTGLELYCLDEVPPTPFVVGDEERLSLTKLILWASSSTSFGELSKYFQLQTLRSLAVCHYSGGAEQVARLLAGTASHLRELSFWFEKSYEFHSGFRTHTALFDLLGDTNTFPQLEILVLTSVTETRIHWPALQSVVTQFLDRAPRLHELRFYLHLKERKVANDILDIENPIPKLDSRLTKISVYMWNPPTFNSELFLNEKAKEVLQNTFGRERLIKISSRYNWSDLTPFCEPVDPL
ncbi:hypothetical protein DL96DRAFT_1703000 [Flagelloscypha sp. PMI_526]|nr:hypothetical protein DL96DRAFT_1703000 [Flagelloscypha sp. PMI_526]